jgi:hypothetical protein
MSAGLRGLTLAGLLLLASCDDEGVLPATNALEPIQVQGGQFFPGPLPTGAGPKVDTVNALATEFVAGVSNQSFSGDADMGASAVLMRFADLGTGYWAVPVGPPDVITPGEVTWSATCDFSQSLPVGPRDLQFVAVDADGGAGPINDLVLRFTSPVPSGEVVLSLTWDSPADLDLHVVAPDGTELDPLHPTTAAMLESDGGLPPGTGVLDRDSNADCIEDSLREEDVVFAGVPTPGTYTLRVDMFSACGAPSADFTVTVRVAGEVKEKYRGLLLAMDADGGGPGSGVFVAALTVDGG